MFMGSATGAEKLEKIMVKVNLGNRSFRILPSGRIQEHKAYFGYYYNWEDVKPTAKKTIAAVMAEAEKKASDVARTANAA